jgi:hypothetical protein
VKPGNRAGFPGADLFSRVRSGSITAKPEFGFISLKKRERNHIDERQLNTA